MGRGDPKAAEELLPVVYEELRRLAARKMAQAEPGQTLQATALVHEAWLKLAGSSQIRWNDRSHFFRAAAEAMRQILIGQARRKSSQKRGGNQVEEELHESRIELRAPSAEILAVHDALDALVDRHIGVSSTNMHLADLAGRTADVLVPWPAEWRWRLAGESPWFPGFRVHRQERGGDWSAALAALAR